MINDVEMLTYVLQNAEMGCRGITAVRKKVRNSKIDGSLCEQLVRYGKIYQCADRMLKSRGAEVRRINPMTRAMTNFAAERDLKRDPTPSHIAEMMIKGNTMGVNKMTRHIRNYDGKDKQVGILAEKMLETEEENIKKMSRFLQVK